MAKHAQDEPLPEDLDRFGDVTTVCPECGATLYDDVDQCYKCGRLLSQARTGPPGWAIIVICVIVGVLVLSMLARVL